MTLKRVWTRGETSPVTVSRLSLSTHAGAHADAPIHWSDDGETVAELPLEPYLGRCRVVDVRGAGDVVRLEHVAAHLDDRVHRVLLRTSSWSTLEGWSEEYSALDPELVHRLGEQGVLLIGVDTPSVDPARSKAMAAHGALRRHKIAVLEGLALDHVPPGDWELIALPLPIVYGDASPVRAVLRGLV
jgi:arylformamidase